MLPDYSTLIAQGLITLVPAVGVVVTLLAARKLTRRTAWLVGTGCAILVTTNLLWLLWGAGAIRPTQPSRHVLGKLYEAGMQLLPLAEAVGLAVLIGAALRGRERPPAARAEVDAPEPERKAKAPFFRTTIAMPTWAVIGVVAVAVGGAVAAAVTPTDDAVPRLVQGTVVSHSDDGTSFVFIEDGADGHPQTYPLHSRLWIDHTDAQRNDGRPACLQPDATTPRRAELAILDITGSRDHNFGDFPYLLSVHCLE